MATHSGAGTSAPAEAGDVPAQARKQATVTEAHILDPGAGAGLYISAYDRKLTFSLPAD